MNIFRWAKYRQSFSTSTWMLNYLIIMTSSALAPSENSVRSLECNLRSLNKNAVRDKAAKRKPEKVSIGERKTLHCSLRLKYAGVWRRFSAWNVCLHSWHISVKILNYWGHSNHKRFNNSKELLFYCLNVFQASHEMNTGGVFIIPLNSDGKHQNISQWTEAQEKVGHATR